MTPELVECGGWLLVSTPDNYEWLQWVYGHDGKWALDSGAWVFQPDQRAAVEAALAEIFGGEDDE